MNFQWTCTQYSKANYRNWFIFQNASLAVAPLIISSLRESVVDFTKPFKACDMNVLIARPEEKSSLLQFMTPLHWSVWMLIVVAVAFLSVVLTMIDRWVSLRRASQNIASRKYSLDLSSLSSRYAFELNKYAIPFHLISCCLLQTESEWWIWCRAATIYLLRESVVFLCLLRPGWDWRHSSGPLCTDSRELLVVLLSDYRIFVYR